jgi:hypothetical protein
MRVLSRGAWCRRRSSPARALGAGPGSSSAAGSRRAWLTSRSARSGSRTYRARASSPPRRTHRRTGSRQRARGRFPGCVRGRPEPATPQGNSSPGRRCRGRAAGRRPAAWWWGGCRPARCRRSDRRSPRRPRSPRHHDRIRPSAGEPEIPACSGAWTAAAANACLSGNVAPTGTCRRSSKFFISAPTQSETSNDGDVAAAASGPRPLTSNTVRGSRDIGGPAEGTDPSGVR